MSEIRQDRYDRHPRKGEGDAPRSPAVEDRTFEIEVKSELFGSIQKLDGALIERQESVKHCLDKTTWLVAATLLANAALLGQVQLSRAEERVQIPGEQRPTRPAAFNHQPAPGENPLMRRLPPILRPVNANPLELQLGATRLIPGELPATSREERRLFERGSIATWNQDPANHSKTVQLLARQDELPAPANDELVTLHLNEVNVRQALEMLSRSHGLSILVAPGVTGQITANLEGLEVDQALDAIVKLGNLVAHREGELIYVYAQTEFPQANFQLHVFPLNFVSAIDVLPVITNLLTPTGQATASSVSSIDNTKAREAVIVTDRPEILQRVEEFIRQVDIPPLQVMIEAHVLKIELGDDLKHGVNYKQAMDALGGNGFEFELKGLADESASPAILARIAGAKVDGLLQLLKTTTDAKTLASPRVMVINGQKARIQVGEQVPYQVLTFTETSSVQELRFLNVGVVLEVTPRISQDGRVMMRVNPKVSSATFGPAPLNLPGEKTRELESDVILEDGLGLVIGGLIQETDTEIQSKLPYFGDLHYVGRLFQRRSVIKERSEIVITLVPRIIYNSESTSARDMVNAEQTLTPLFHGPLHRVVRPWEPQLPDAIHNPERLRRQFDGRCRSCQQQSCDCDFSQPLNAADKPLAPTPVELPSVAPESALAPPIPDAVWVTQPPAGTRQLGPPPVQVQPFSGEEPGNIRFAHESHPPIPRTQP